MNKILYNKFIILLTSRLLQTNNLEGWAIDEVSVHHQHVLNVPNFFSNLRCFVDEGAYLLGSVLRHSVLTYVSP
jgi:hypothetical protein